MLVHVDDCTMVFRITWHVTGGVCRRAIGGVIILRVSGDDIVYDVTEVLYGSCEAGPHCGMMAIVWTHIYVAPAVMVDGRVGPISICVSPSIFIEFGDGVGHICSGLWRWLFCSKLQFWCYSCNMAD